MPQSELLHGIHQQLVHFKASLNLYFLRYGGFVALKRTVVLLGSVFEPIGLFYLALQMRFVKSSLQKVDLQLTGLHL